MPLNSSSADKESFLTCKNSQGVLIRASVLRLTRYIVAFEVYNPYSILQLSEVLTDFRIFVNTKLVYTGRATVRNLVNTGIYLVCEVALQDGWLDVDVFSPVTQKDRLLTEFQEFIEEWTSIHQVGRDFKVVVSDIQSLLAGLRGWLEQVELAIRSEPSAVRSTVEEQVIVDLQPPILPQISGLFERFEDIAVKIPEPFQPLHQFYLRRQLHPLILCAPFVYRTYQKPLGYAGDYEMVNMILRSPYEGSSLFAKMLNAHFWSQPPAEAHRNRIKYLTSRILSETQRVSRLGRNIKIFNLGCGPAKEIQNFLAQEDISDLAEFTLIDFNEETLLYTTKLLSDLQRRYSRKTAITYEQKSVSQILKDSGRTSAVFEPGKYDIVYCAGLFDYLSDRVCQRMMNIFYDLLAPDGLLVATNVSAHNPVRNQMEYLLDWNLIYRDEKQLESLRPAKADRSEVTVTADPTSVNIFIEVQKQAKTR